MRFDELKVDQLKKELSKLDLPTAGNKVELQKRLIEEFKQRGIDIDTYEFEKEEMQVTAVATTAVMDFNAMFVAMMEKIETNYGKLLAEMQETYKADFKKLLDENNEKQAANNKKLAEKLDETYGTTMKALAEAKAKLQQTSRAYTVVQENSRDHGEELPTEVQTDRAVVDEKSRAKDDQQVQISVRMSERIDLSEVQVDKIEEHPLSEEVCGLEMMSEQSRDDGEKLYELDENSTDLGGQSEPSTDAAKGFDTVTSETRWDNEEKAIELDLSLKGNAAVNDCEEIMAAKQCKYGGEEKGDNDRMELRGREQNTSETLQDFAMEVERLVQPKHPRESHPILEHLMIEVIRNGTRVHDVEVPGTSILKLIFGETVRCELAQATVRLPERVQRNYKVPRKRARSPSPTKGLNLRAMMNDMDVERVASYGRGDSVPIRDEQA